MKFISWNVNGLRAVLKKGFAESFATLDADIFCLQETKCQPGQAEFEPEGYTEYFYSAEKKGYSGTACYCKQPPLSGRYGIGPEEHSHEGRAITLEYPEFYLVNVYTPNAQEGLARIEWHRQRGDELVLISASGEHLVAPMAQMLGMDHCVAILLDEEAGMLTGQTRGTLSFREGKVARINQLFAGKEHLWQGSFGYSDSHNDLPMLRAVSHPHAVNPAPALRQCAEELGWPLWTWQLHP